VLWQDRLEALQQHVDHAVAIDLDAFPASFAAGSTTFHDDEAMYPDGASQHCIWLGNRRVDVCGEVTCGSSISSDGESSQQPRNFRGSSGLPSASGPRCEEVPWPSLRRPGLPPVPIVLLPGVLSLGSQLHGTGECRPCFYSHSKKGCHFGVACVFCHGDHVKKRKARPPKHVRLECRSMAHATFDQYSEAPPEIAEAHLQEQELLNTSHAPSKYASVVLRALYRSRDVAPASSLEAASREPLGSSREPCPEA